MVQLVHLRAATGAGGAGVRGDPGDLAVGGAVGEGLPGWSRRPGGRGGLEADPGAGVADPGAGRGGGRRRRSPGCAGCRFFGPDALGPVPGRRRAIAKLAGDITGTAGPANDREGRERNPRKKEKLPALPDPVPRDAERALARFGLLGEGAAPVFTPGARYPLAGLLLTLPPLAGTGLLGCARQVYGRLRNGFYGLEAMLVLLVFLALAREARAEGATRIPPAAPGRVLGLDRAPEVKTIRRKPAELAGAGKAADLQMALARHHAGARPDELGFMYIDGHTRAYFGKRDIQKMHVARLKHPGPATEETLVTRSPGTRCWW